MGQFTVLSGNLGRDAELKDVGENTVLEFSIAVSDYAGKTKGNVTTWFKCSYWNRPGLAASLTRGTKVIVQGRLISHDGNPRVFNRNDGTPGASFEFMVSNLEFGGKVGDNDGQGGGGQSAPRQAAPTRVQANKTDDIPF
jgi:single-strand DNA-binding protein